MGSQASEVIPSGQPTDWQEIRASVLVRDGRRCADCSTVEHAADLDIHHLVPRSAGGSDEPSNLITLCDGCHGARHPNLQVSLSRRMIERWALRLVRVLDRQHEFPEELHGLPAALRLLGVDRLREGQLEVISAALRGESVLAVRPTGSGKTLCFQLPALLSSGPTIVLSPLKALMKDQVAELQRLKLPGTFINGDLSPDEKEARYQLLAAGTLKFLYCTPERFNSERVRAAEVERITRMRPSFLVVDEAHCVNRWGDDFRPDYAVIAEIREKLGNPPVIALTATAGPQARDDILESLGVPDAKRVISDVDRPNIALIRHDMPGDVRSPVQVQERAKLIASLIGNLKSGKAMIFVPTVRIGEALRAALVTEGLELPFYHSKLGSPNERDVIIGQFTGRLDPPLQAVICTNAFGMGMDVPDVRLVVNWQHPSSVEDYLQEFGRAGRDGKGAVALLLTDMGQEVGLLEFMAKKTDSPDPSASGKVIARRLDAIDEISALVRGQKGCFREKLRESLEGGDRPPKPSLAARVFQRFFGSRRRVSRPPFCCDSCDSKKAAQYLSGELSI